nr:hypothetical protein [Methylomarinum sp. Ch1-1]MDP4519501.1 hypothetical protein [Methylomarinum sp. Ch1-1]
MAGDDCGDKDARPHGFHRQARSIPYFSVFFELTQDRIVQRKTNFNAALNAIS